MMKKKIALLSSWTPSTWQSCRAIIPNIIKVYERQDAHLVYLNFHRSINALECLHTAQEIKDKNIDIIAFVDHSPHPKNLLRPLEFVLRNTSKRPKLIFHLYGDFPLYCTDWIEIETLLKHYKCKFLVASDRQQHFISKFFKVSHNKVFKIPFPVDEKQFRVDEDVRWVVRNQFKIERKSPVFIYTGRISAQKQLISLIKNFIKASKQVSNKPVLFIAGGFDDLGTPFIGDCPLPCDYSSRFYRLLQDIDPRQTMIKFVGQLNKKKLFEYYNASDYFISLSIHNDEDYGMSPIEAMFCGNSSILTDWAGLASFQTKKSFCQMVPVNFLDGTIVLDHSMAVNLYAKAMTNPLMPCRKNISEHYQKVFGIQALTTSLKNILFGRFNLFQSYGPSFYLFNAYMKSSPHAPFSSFKNSKKYGPFYKEVYAPYFRNISQDS